MGDGSASRFVKAAVAALAVGTLVAWWPGPAPAAEPSAPSFLSMYFTEEELHVLAATRSIKAIEHVAENVTVVTAEDIRLMNAHTLAEVLETVPGFHVYATGRFGPSALGQILGSEIRHVAVLWNGVPVNTLGDNFALLELIPVTDIGRVEIVKGPASSAWGSALGGVVNVVSADVGGLPVEGEVRASYGTEASGDYRASLTGRAGRLGYFVAGTRLETDGLTHGFDGWQNHLMAHLTFDLTGSSRLRLDYADSRDDRGDGRYEADDQEYRTDDHHRRLSLGMAAALGGGFEGDLSLWAARIDDGYFLNSISEGTEIFGATSDQRRTGGTAKVAWRGMRHAAVAGVDVARDRLEVRAVPGRTLRGDSAAVFGNATLDFGRVTVTPGLRYDDLSTVGDVLSPSLGVTCALAERALLRATAARGFSAPTLTHTLGSSEVFGYRANPDLDLERVWSYEAGVESDLARRLWVKVSLFRHEVEDALVTREVADDPLYVFTYDNAGRQRRDGLSVEWRTAPWHDLAFHGGATWVRATDRETDEPLQSVPNQEFQGALTYDDRRSVQVQVQGRYFREHPTEGVGARYRNMLVDVHARKRFMAGGRVALELFASAHNVFDGTLVSTGDIYPNVGRWFEAGASVTF